MREKDNYLEHQKAISDLSIVDIVKVIDYINELSTFIPQENEVLDNLEEIIKPLCDVQNKLLTDKKCSVCGSRLFKSDNGCYDYVCVNCGEHFIEDKEKRELEVKYSNINLLDTAKTIVEVLADRSFDDITDNSGYYVIRSFKDGSERCVDIIKSTAEDKEFPHYAVYVLYEDDTSNYEYTDDLSVDGLYKLLKKLAGLYYCSACGNTYELYSEDECYCCPYCGCVPEE